MNTIFRRSVHCTVLLLALLPTHSLGKQLPAPIQFVLDGYSIPKTAYSIYIKALGAEQATLSVNANSQRNPASAIKIVTTLAALEILGPAWNWKTKIYTRGQVKNGTLNGDLVMKGYGDPYLSTEELWKLLKYIQRNGIREIHGNLLIDDTYFDIAYKDPGAFDNKPLRSYNVQPNAFLVNFKSVYFHFSPAGNGRDVNIHTDPELANLEIDNRLRQKKSSCQGFQRGITASIPEQAMTDKIIFAGKFPSRCSQYTLARTALDHHTFAFGAFKSLWQQLGGTITGKVGSTTVQKSEKPFLVWTSKALSDVIKLVNKYSNNVMTRQLLLTVGAIQHDAPGTVEKGKLAIKDHLTKAGLDTSSLYIANGAGLSRETRISAKLLVDILEHADKALFQAEFKSSLAIIGHDGTARKRLKGKKEAGHAHIKTGTIDHVSAVAGYVTAKSGRRYAIAAMLNDKDAHRGPGTELMNAIIRWTYKQ